MPEIKDEYAEAAKQEFAEPTKADVLAVNEDDAPELKALKESMAADKAAHTAAWDAPDEESKTSSNSSLAPKTEAPAPVVADVSAPAPAAPKPKTYSAADFRAEFKAQRAAGAKDFEWQRPDGTKYRVATTLKSEMKPKAKPAAAPVAKPVTATTVADKPSTFSVVKKDNRPAVEIKTPSGSMSMRTDGTKPYTVAPEAKPEMFNDPKAPTLTKGQTPAKSWEKTAPVKVMTPKEEADAVNTRIAKVGKVNTDFK